MSIQLTQKQQKFCNEILIDGNATRSAISAGYSERGAAVTACNLLTNAKISSIIDKSRAEQSIRTLVDADYVITSIKAIAETAMQVDPDTGKMFDASAANRALELLGKHLKLFTDKTEVSAPGIEQILNSLQSTSLVRDGGPD
ncbi:terminase small subunit [bacterium]|nr:terminase small subunit [bacterium]